MNLRDYIEEAISSRSNTYIDCNLTPESEMLDFLEAFKRAGFKMLSKDPSATIRPGKDGQCWMILRHDMQMTIVRLFFSKKEYLLMFRYNDHKLEKCIKYNNQNGKHPVRNGDYDIDKNIKEICDELGTVTEAISSGRQRSLDTLIDNINEESTMSEVFDILTKTGFEFYTTGDLTPPIALDLMNIAMEKKKVCWCCGSEHISCIYIAIPSLGHLYSIDFYKPMNSAKNSSKRDGIWKIDIFQYLGKGSDHLERKDHLNRDNTEQNIKKLKKLLEK